jgi:hypothetical protein
MSFARSDKPPYKNFPAAATRAGRQHWRRARSLRYGEGKAALALMRNGEVLRREFVRGRERWSLSGGFKLAPFVVRHLLSNPEIVAADDSLLVGMSQTFTLARLARGLRVPPRTPQDKRKANEMDMSKFVKRILTVADVKASGPRILHIAKVEEGRYDKPVLVFDNGERLTLSETNNLILQGAYGPDSDHWTGKKVELAVGELTYNKKPVEAIIVKPISPGLTEVERVAATTKLADAERDEHSIERDSSPAGNGRAVAAGSRNSDMDDDIPFAPEWR